MLSTITVKKHLHDLPPPTWQRWLPFWHGLNYAVTLGVAVVALQHKYSSGQTRLLLLLGLLIWLCWYSVCVWLKPRWWENHSVVMYLYLFIGGVLWVLLSNINAVCMLLSFTLYTQIFLYVALPWKVILAILVASLQLALEVIANGGWNMNFLVFFVVSLLSIALALFVTSVIQQSVVQRHLIKALEMQRKQLVEEERRAGISEERQRLAYEIHDTLAQGFTSILMHLEAADLLLPENTGSARQHIDQARLTASENILEARQLIWALQPDPASHVPLPDVLHTLTRRWEKESGVSTTVVITGNPHDLRPNYQHTLIRTAQETLTNVRKHAQATQVTVTLSYLDDAVILDIQDDGHGFCQDTAQSSDTLKLVNGVGLQGVKARVEKLGGTLVIESVPDEGTTIAVTLPAPQAESEKGKTF